MKPSEEDTMFIDLSFLSPEEEAVIQSVLLRDEDLKRQETGRVRKLEASVPDPNQLKVFSGEWFEELRSKRYGRQPHVSAIVRSSMRWKKSTAHKPNPFLHSLPEGKDGEKNKTCPEVSTDPRSVHPALSLQVQQEKKDDIIMSEGHHRARPKTKVIEAESSSEENLQDHTILVQSLKLQPIQASQTKSFATNEINTNISDSEQTGLKGEKEVVTSLEARLKRAEGYMSRNFKIRSFSKAKETSTWKIHQFGSDYGSNNLQPEVGDVMMNFENTTDKKNELSPKVMMNSGFEFEKEMNAPVPKKRSSKQIPTRMEELSEGLNLREDSDHLNLKSSTVSTIAPPLYDQLDEIGSGPVHKEKEQAVEEIIAADFKQRSPIMIEELSIELDVEKDPDVLEGPVNDVNITKHFNWDKNSFELDPVHRGEESSVQKIMVTDFERRSPIRMENLSEDADMENYSDVLKGQVNNVKTAKCADLDKTFDLVQTGKERAFEEIRVTDFTQRFPTTEEGFNVDLNLENDTHIPEGPVNVNITKCLKWDQKSFGPEPVQKEKELAVEEIIVDDFKQRSPTKKEESKVVVNVKGSLDTAVELKTGSAHQDVTQLDMFQDDKHVMINGRNEVAGGKGDCDEELKMSESTNQKVSKQVEEVRDLEGGFQAREHESWVSESDILASVYARAAKPKLGVSKISLSQNPMQKMPVTIPTIVVMPSESEQLQEMEGRKDKIPVPEALAEVITPGTNTWQDEGVDSDEDSSSASSHDSDRSGKRGQFSASTLSVTERTGSLLSVYSDAGDFGNVLVQGSVEFAIMYSPVGELVIMVEQCQDLAIANPRKQRTDPYVKTYLYPDKRSKRKTSIKKRTVNPVYVESLRYKVKCEELHGRTLNLSVWHNDSRGRNVFLGQVEINLKDWDWKHEALTWYDLQPKNTDNQDSQEDHGVLSVSLKFVPPEAIGISKLSQPMGEIHIWLHEAKHLCRLKTQGVNSFVKCYMLPDTSKKSRQKTRVVKKTQNPVYNHTMVYNGFGAGEVCEACCELTVWDNNKLSNQFLGGVRLSLGTGQSYGKKVDWMDSENEEVEIWEKMMVNPNNWVQAELPLRSSMTPRK